MYDEAFKMNAGGSEFAIEYLPYQSVDRWRRFPEAMFYQSSSNGLGGLLILTSDRVVPRMMVAETMGGFLIGVHRRRWIPTGPKCSGDEFYASQGQLVTCCVRQWFSTFSVIRNLCEKGCNKRWTSLDRSLFFSIAKN